MKSGKSHFVLIVWVLVAAAVCHGQIVVDHTTVEMLPDDSLTEIIPLTYLNQARQQKILFCHASVGGTIMTAMTSTTSNLSLLKIDPNRYTIDGSNNAPASWFDTHTGIIDIGPTGWPYNGSKALGFDNHIRNLGYGQSGRANVAFFKYCYIDWTYGMNYEARWNEYISTMEDLEDDFPNITFVYWTTLLSRYKSNNNSWLCK